MDIRQLKYFIAVAEEQNIGRAAIRLHMSQPPLTRQIHALEEELGVVLFIRTKWGVELTETGKYLLGQARNILGHVELVREHAKRAGNGQVGRVDIGVFGSAMLSAIPKILSSFSLACPDVNVVLHTMKKGQQIEALHRGRIMLAFERYLPDSPGLQVERVCREPLHVAFHARHRLASLETVQLHHLSGESLIGETIPSPAIEYLLKHPGFKPVIVQKAEDMISAAVMVAGGFGTAIVPESLKSLRLPNVIYRDLVGEPAVTMELHCAYRADETSPLLAPLLEIVRDFRAEQEAVMEAREAVPADRASGPEAR